MSQRRKDHEKMFITRHKLNQSLNIEQTKNEKDSNKINTNDNVRVIGKIRRLVPIQPVTVNKKDVIKKQQIIIEQSKKNNYLYHLKKYFYNYLYELVDEAVERV